MIAALVSVTVKANTVDENNQKLKQVQEKIKQQRVAIEKQLAEKDDLQALFKSTELKVAEVALTIRQTNNKLTQVNKKVSELEKEQRELLRTKKQQQKLLAELVRNAYLSGKHDYTKLLLNQDDPTKLERLITYYKSLNDARVKELESIQRVLNRLAEVEVELTEQKSQLIALKDSQQEQKRQMAKSQTARRSALRKMNASIKSEQSRLKELEQSETRLENAIARAQQQATKTPEDLIGLYNLKKQLKWPTSGRIRKKFGQRRSGALRWKGVQMSANLGNRVNAIADGIVLYSDWLKGFGWVTVIDHGKGYMSLYGHNQALLKAVGDYVEQNEPIALVGQSGGQSEPGLYFEIRYKGKTVNPARWCR
jgi:septal ring factor EnvC (AmiA/AmiB activator)